MKKRQDYKICIREDCVADWENGTAVEFDQVFTELKKRLRLIDWLDPRKIIAGSMLISDTLAGPENFENYYDWAPDLSKRWKIKFVKKR